MMADLDEALVLVSTNFRGVTDKSGAPYVLHCIRAMMSVNSLDAKMVAVMHDLVEDTSITLDDLRTKGFSDAVVEAVGLVTHRSDVSYEDYIVRIKTNPLALEVKLADLKDNTSLGRALYREESKKRDSTRIQKYLISYQFLTDVIDEASYRRQMDSL
jgi:(p)ppGpp synthase/HD superfamily hydrolase